MFKSAGMTDDIRLHNICLFIAQEAGEWHTLVSFDCLVCFFFLQNVFNDSYVSMP